MPAKSATERMKEKKARQRRKRGVLTPVGKKISRKLRGRRRGYKHDAATKRKISLSMKRYWNSGEGKKRRKAGRGRRRKRAKKA